MNKSMAWDPASIHSQARRLAEEAADRAGMTLQEWLDEAILRCSAAGAPGATAAPEGGGVPEGLGRSMIEETEDLVEQAMERIDRRVRCGEERMARALESLTSVFDAARASAGRRDPERAAAARNRRLDDRLEEIARRMDAARLAALAPGAPPGPMGERPPLDPRPAVSRIAPRPATEPSGEAGIRSRPAEDADHARQKTGARAGGRAGSEDEAAGATTSGHDLPEEPGEDAGIRERDPPQSCQPSCAVDLTAMRQGLAAMNRSLAELAPRNALVALEGAVRDLTERVALLRRDGGSESLLAPLDAMAAELRASLRSWDPQAAVGRLEREISALAGRVEALAESAVDPECFDRIQQQTEEVRNLLAAAATRSAPLDRLERQIGELADRVEGIAASKAPQVESAEMAASLAELRSEIERAAPLATLSLIERRLEHIAERLDEAVAPSAQAAAPYRLEDLARRIEDVHHSLSSGLQTRIDTSALESSLRELSAKIDNPAAEPLAALVRDIGDRLDSAGRREAEAAPATKDLLQRMHSIERVLIDLGAKFDSGPAHAIDRALLTQIAEAVAQRLHRDFPFRMDAQGLAEQIAYVHTRLEDLPQLDEMQALMRRIASQLGDPAGSRASHHEAEAPFSAERPRGAGTAAFAVKGIESLEAMESAASQTRPFRTAGAAGAEEAPEPPAADEDVLLEPGAGAPHRLRDARESARDTGQKSSPSISVHIAAARRAAHSALSEGSGQTLPAAAPAGGQDAERTKSFYASRKRPVLFAAGFALVAIAAIRLVGLYGPSLQKSELIGRSAKIAEAGSPPGAAAKIDVTPTASIPPDSAGGKAEARREAAEPELSAALSAELPASLRDAVVAGSPAAEYELAQRLLEGRALSQDQKAAAFWFERAASSGLAPAEFRLAMLYSKGVGLPRDGAAARRWYEKAAEAGNARAAHNLGVLYAEPAGDKRDYTIAAKWFLEAAKLGVRDSQFNLAVLYARGLGVDQDLEQSWMWFSLAAAQGDADAAKKRDEVAAKMTSEALAAAAADLARFKPNKPDPAANDVAPPPGGWDGKSAASRLVDPRPGPGPDAAASP